jgi:hypothetical protein
MGGRVTVQLPKGAFITRLRAPVHEGDVDSLKVRPSPSMVRGEVTRNPWPWACPGWVSQNLLRDLAIIHGMAGRGDRVCPLTHKCMQQCPYAWLGVDR